MNRHVFYIIISIICLLIPIIGVLYGIWDSNQPKIGPVGNGSAKPSIFHFIPLITSFVTGALNLPIAIIRYKKHRASEKETL